MWEAFARRQGRAHLSPRERQVLTLVIAGKLNKQIEHELGTTERTIKAHRHNLMGKLNARSFVELLAIVEQAGRSLVAAIDKRDSAPHSAK